MSSDTIYLAVLAFAAVAGVALFWLATRGDYRDQVLGAEFRKECGGYEEAQKELTEIRVRNAQMDSLMRAGMRRLSSEDIDLLLAPRAPIAPQDFVVTERGKPLRFEDGAA